MNLLRTFPIMAFGLMLLSIVGLCVAQHSVELLLVAGALAVVSWYVTEGPRGRHLPPWVSTLLTLAVLINLVVEVVQRDHWLQAMGRFAVWMTLIKLYERKTPAAYRVLLLLSLLLMLAGAVQSADLLFGAVLALYAMLGLYVVVLYQVYAAHERARDERRQRSPREERLVPPVKVIMGRHGRMQFRLLTGGATLVGIGLSVIVFLIFPRGWGQGAMPALVPNATVRRTGPAQSVDLRAGGRITESRRMVMTARVVDAPDQATEGETLLLRRCVLDEYLGDGRWATGGRLERQVQVGPDRFAPLAGAAPAGDPVPEPAEQRMVIEVEPIAADSLLVTHGLPVGVRSDHAAELRFAPATRMLAWSGPPRRDAYAIETLRAPGDATVARFAGDRRPGRRPNSALLQERVADLARRLLREAGLEEQPPTGSAAAAERAIWIERAAVTFADHLRGGTYAYDLDQSDVVGDSDDPIARFLFRTRRGHCEYFASAFAALCANVSIPVRLVAGYAACEFDRAGGQYLVREMHAHAWAEVRTSRQRWIEFDPTPASVRRPQAAQVTLADRLGLVYQRLEVSWDAGVRSFDSGAQSAMAESLDARWSERLASAASGVRAWLIRVNRAFYFGPAGYIWMGIVAFALGLAVAVLVRLRRRGSALRRTLRLRHRGAAEERRMVRRLGFYLDMLQVLERARMPKPAWCPPLLHARTLGPRHPEAAELVGRISDLFYRCRYGRAPVGAEEVAGARRLVEQLRRVLAAP
jgi:transglutaminase-like putative cysteine protease